MIETGRLLTTKDNLRRSFRRTGPSPAMTLLAVFAAAAAALVVGLSYFDLSDERIATEQDLQRTLTIEPAAPPAENSQ